MTTPIVLPTQQQQNLAVRSCTIILIIYTTNATYIHQERKQNNRIQKVMIGGVEAIKSKLIQLCLLSIKTMIPRSRHLRQHLLNTIAVSCWLEWIVFVLVLVRVNLSTCYSNHRYGVLQRTIFSRRRRRLLLLVDDIYLYLTISTNNFSWKRQCNGY